MTTPMNDITIDTQRFRIVSTDADEASMSELARTKSHLSALYRTGQTISSILNTTELYTSSLNIIQTEIRTVDFCSIHVLNEETKKLECKATRGRKPGYQQEKLFSSSILNCVMNEKKAILTFDAQGDNRFDGSVSIANLSIRSAMCVPLQSQNRLLGVIQANTISPRNKFNKEDLKLLIAIGFQIGIAIENALLYEKQQADKEELQRINEKLRITQQSLVQSEKLAAVGQLTAGIVHDVKNPLVVIKGHSELMQTILKEEGIAEVGGLDLQDSLQEVQKDVTHCYEIIEQLLQFAKQKPIEKKPVQVNRLLQSTFDFLGHEFKKSSTKLITNYGDKLPLVMIDENQVKQTLMNIIINAIQAMEKHGEMTIETLLDETEETPFILIKISDNGSGMPEEVKKSIFDPFFSTKKSKSGECGGTGLGLSVSYGIIENHGGTILVDSELGKGSTFTIKLPVKKL